MKCVFCTFEGAGEDATAEDLFGDAGDISSGGEDNGSNKGTGDEVWRIGGWVCAGFCMKDGFQLI